MLRLPDEKYYHVAFVYLWSWDLDSRWYYVMLKFYYYEILFTIAGDGCLASVLNNYSSHWLYLGISPSDRTNKVLGCFRFDYICTYTHPFGA